MYVSKMPPYVGLVSRRKFGGLLWHVGVMLPNGMVAHWTPAGVAIVSLAEFSAGEVVRYHTPVPHHRHGHVLHRAVLSVGHARPYDLFARNCEHYARWVLAEVPESPQVGRAVGLALIGMALAIAAR